MIRKAVREAREIVAALLDSLTLSRYMQGWADGFQAGQDRKPGAPKHPLDGKCM